MKTLFFIAIILLVFAIILSSVVIYDNIITKKKLLSLKYRYDLLHLQIITLNNMVNKYKNEIKKKNT
jgi:hypothetical protein